MDITTRTVSIWSRDNSLAEELREAWMDVDRQYRALAERYPTLIDRIKWSPKWDAMEHKMELAVANNRKSELRMLKDEYLAKAKVFFDSWERKMEATNANTNLPNGGSDTR